MVLKFGLWQNAVSFWMDSTMLLLTMRKWYTVKNWAFCAFLKHKIDTAYICVRPKVCGFPVWKPIIELFLQDRSRGHPTRVGLSVKWEPAKVGLVEARKAVGRPRVLARAAKMVMVPARDAVEESDSSEETTENRTNSEQPVKDETRRLQCE